MICHEYKCIFVHVPKTAGISVEHVFVDRLGLTWETRAPLLLRLNDDPKRGPRRLAHLKASEYVSCGHITEELFRSYYKFSFVRNPWDRIVSEYKYRGYPRKMDFKTYLFKHLPKPGWTDEYCHIIPQYEFLFDQDGSLLVDFVGRYERLQTDFDEVCGKIGLPTITLPHVNKSLQEDKSSKTKLYLRKLKRLAFDKQKKNTFEHYVKYYDDESREFVSMLFSKDIEVFKYQFGDP